MEQASMRLRRGGWSPNEANMLWETADEAQQQGLPLKSVFERVAAQTGRRPNSIRNYYYAQVQKRLGDEARPARFVPFTQDEVEKLVKGVLTATAKGQSVRSCLKRMSAGDHSLMLRYQNKYRSVIKNRPDMVVEIVKQLGDEGVSACVPSVSRRSRATLSEACERLTDSARRNEYPELVKACETLSDFIVSFADARNAAHTGLGARLEVCASSPDRRESVLSACKAANGLLSVIKEYLGQPPQSRKEALDEFCRALSARIGDFEVNLQRLESECAV